MRAKCDSILARKERNGRGREKSHKWLITHQVTGMTKQKDQDWMVLLNISCKEGAERAMEWAKDKLANGNFTKRNGVRPLWQSSTSEEEDDE